jgi:hypothetical protein
VNKETCPKGKHFHLFGKDVFERDNRQELIEASDPNQALEKFILNLDEKWEGAIEVKAHGKAKESNLALIDFWRTPLR